MSKRISSLVLLVAIALLTSGAQATETVAQDTVVCREALLLGPLPGTPDATETTLPLGSHKVVPEIVPQRVLPSAGKKGWQTIGTDAAGDFQLTTPGVYWIAARLRTDRYTKASLMLDHGSALYSDGTELSSQEPGVAAMPLSATTTVTRGWVTVTARVILTEDNLSFSLQATADSLAAPQWDLDEAIALTRFADTDQLTTIGSLAVTDDGRFIARYLTRRSDDRQVLDVLNAKGRVVAADLGGGRMRPVGFRPGSHELLLRRGDDLILWQAPDGEPRTVLKDESNLGFMKFSPAGNTLLFGSSKGFKATETSDTANRRYTHFRERITDYAPITHLHLLDLSTGVRRLLTRPGDFVQDDAVFSADGQTILYGRTLPQAARPWFTSEIRRLDLSTGQDDLITGFTSGWEVRPQAFAVSPDGKYLAFVGPPEEITDDAPQHNVYHTQMWLLDLTSGQYERITHDEVYAFERGGGFPVFDGNNRLLVRLADRSAKRVGRLTRGRDGWQAEALPQHGASLGAVTLSANHEHLAYAASSPARMPALYLAAVGKAGRLLAEPNDELAARTIWAGAEDVSFRGPGGEDIEAWFYPPLQMPIGSAAVWQNPASGSFPLIVYYYGGSVPTLRSFGTTFQFLAANGYGVMVVNTRGSAGYGQDFADHHAGDWGPDAAADIIAATENVLKVHPYLDRQTMGIYGGSYGGFMTNYLVTHTDLYAAAVSMYGISELTTYFGQGAWGVTYGDMAFGGRNPWSDPRYFVEHSPVFHADQLKTPLLLLHGMADTNVTTGESIQLFTELSVLDKPVEMVLFPGEGHGISGTWDNRVAHRTMLLEWFDRWLKGQPAAWHDRWQ